MPLHDDSPHRRPLVEPFLSHVDRDRTDALLTATGRGDLGAFAEFYDRTVPTVFGLLHHATTRPDGSTRAAEQATTRVYLTMWCTAPRFEADARSAYSTLLSVARHELAGQISRAGTS